MKEDTKIVHKGRDPKSNHGIINPPVYHASTIAWGSVEEMQYRRDHRWEPGVYTYGRHGTPTHEALEEAYAAVSGGYRSVALASGLAAINAAMLAYLKQGDHILMVDCVYGPARNFCDNIVGRFGVETTYYDPKIGAGIKDLIRENTKIVYVEAPGSVTFDMQDIPAIAEEAHKAGCVVMMDDTWSAGIYFKPFENGVDVCAMAATKYIVGHSDVMMGLITTNEEHWDIVRPSAAALGANSGPDDIYLALRGLRTLKVRLDRHMETGITLAKWLQDTPRGRPGAAPCPAGASRSRYLETRLHRRQRAFLICPQGRIRGIAYTFHARRHGALCHGRKLGRLRKPDHAGEPRRQPHSRKMGRQGPADPNSCRARRPR